MRQGAVILAAFGNARLAATRVFERRATARGLEVQEATDAETEVAVPVARVAVEAEGGPAEGAAKLPGAAAHYTTVAFIRTLRVFFRAAPVVGTVIPVST